MTQLDTIKYTSHDAAARLGISENEFRIHAKRLDMSAPFSEDMVRAIAAEVDGDNTANIATAEAQPAPATIATSNGLSPAMMGFCDELESEIVNRLTTEMASRLPRIKGAIVDNLLPNQ
jgi:hypothetical protein